SPYRWSFPFHLYDLAHKITDRPKVSVALFKPALFRYCSTLVTQEYGAMKDNYDRSISLQCPTCGGTDFEQNDTEQVKCYRCERVLTKAELREANNGLVEAEVEDLKAELLKDVRDDFKKMFSKWK
ncbi:ECs_2282 family putative zinc-binding protein, partial [Novosphingobium indicum]